MSALPACDTLLAGDLPVYTHAQSDVTGLATDLTNRPVKGWAWAVSKAAVINSSGQLDGAAGTATDCVLVNGSSAAKANATHTHAATDIVSCTLDNARTSGTASATASTLVLRDGSGGGVLRLCGGEQPMGLPGLPLPVARVRRIPNGRWSLREHGEVCRRFHRRDLGQRTAAPARPPRTPQPHRMATPPPTPSRR